MTKSTALLLDTHTWIWLMQGSSELRPSDIKLINQAGTRGAIFVSVISVWEIATLVAKRRIVLQTSVHDWVEKAFQQPGVQLLPLTTAIAIESTQLGADFHGDPADRMLVASARLHELLFLTRDAKILDYAAEGFLQVREV